MAHGPAVNSVAFSPDGTRVLSGSRDNMLSLWDAANGYADSAPLRRHSDWVNSVAFSPDGTRMLSGSDDGTMKLWDGATGKLLRVLWLLTGEGADVRLTVTSVAFSPDGTRLLSGDYDGTVRLWNAAHR